MIHRKNQEWLYQKYKTEQEKANIKKIVFHKTNSACKSEETSDKLYYFLDVLKFAVPVGIFIIAICFMV